jgi:tripartite ATP-independent transporter DctM subunit
MTVLVVFLILLALILLGVPIAVGMGLTAVAVMLWMGGPDLLVMLTQRMYSATTSFPLLAIPFFILAGNLMNTGGMTYRIFDFAHLFVGRVSGGLAHVNVIGSMIFAGMSGSAVADAAGLGTVEIAAMKKAGYSARFAAAITCASSTIGPIIPPSIPFVIYGSLAEVSVGALFLGGIVPGVIMGVGLMAAIALLARRMRLPRIERRPTGRDALRISADALPALLTPIIIMGGILSGFFTPTEAAVVAAVYALGLGLFYYRELGLTHLAGILWTTGRQTAQVMFIIAAAAAFGWVLVQQQIPNRVINDLLSLSNKPWVILVFVNLILLVLGMFIEGIAIMIIVFPIFVPLMAKIGVSPVHFGVMMTLNLMIGLLTPPVGMALYVVSDISRVPMGELVVEMWPYTVALVVVLGLITYVPGLTLFVPNLFGFG